MSKSNLPEQFTLEEAASWIISKERNNNLYNKFLDCFKDAIKNKFLTPCINGQQICISDDKKIDEITVKPVDLRKYLLGLYCFIMGDDFTGHSVDKTLIASGFIGFFEVINRGSNPQLYINHTERIEVIFEQFLHKKDKNNKEANEELALIIEDAIKKLPDEKNDSSVSDKNLKQEELRAENKKLTREEVIEMVTNEKSLKGADLAGIDLCKVDFSTKEYGGLFEKVADFRETNLSKADLSTARLCGAILREANLSEANLHLTDLRGAKLIGADLSDADLSDAWLRRANLNGANLKGAKLRMAQLFKAEFHEADLSGANLRLADLSEADFHGANLSEANLHGANLSSADFENANLTGADFSSANIYHINPHGLDINGIIYPTHVSDYDPVTESRKGFIKCPIEFKKPEDFEKYLHRKSISQIQKSRVKKRWDNDEEKKEKDMQKEKAKEWVRKNLVKDCSCDHIQFGKYMFHNFDLIFSAEKKDYHDIIKEVLRELNGNEAYKRIRNHPGFRKLPPCPIHE